MLEKFPGFETNNRDELTDILAAKFKASRFNAKDFQTRAHWAELKSSQLSVVSYRGDNTEILYGATPFVRYYVMTGDSGGLTFQIQAEEYELSAKSPYVCMPANTSFKVKSYGDHNLLALRIHIEPLNALKRKLLHTTIDEAFMAPNHQISAADPWARSLGQRVRQFADDLDLLGPQGHPDFAQSFEHALLAQFVVCTSAASERVSDESRARPSMFQLRQVEDYINAHSSRPIEIGELAAEFDMSARSIFRLFERERNQTPLDYIKTVRLKNARQKLQRADGRASVTGIALECGFSSLGHFARDYYSCFHELPSHTLKKHHGTI